MTEEATGMLSSAHNGPTTLRPSHTQSMSCGLVADPTSSICTTPSVLVCTPPDRLRSDRAATIR